MHKPANAIALHLIWFNFFQQPLSKCINFYRTLSTDLCSTETFIIYRRYSLSMNNYQRRKDAKSFGWNLVANQLVIIGDRPSPSYMEMPPVYFSIDIPMPSEIVISVMRWLCVILLISIMNSIFGLIFLRTLIWTEFINKSQFCRHLTHLVGVNGIVMLKTIKLW